MTDASGASMEKELAEIDRRLERAQVMFMEEVIDLETLKARAGAAAPRRGQACGRLAALCADLLRRRLVAGP